MKKFIMTLIIALNVMLGAMPVFAKPATSTAAAVEENEFEQEVFELINKERSKQGLSELKIKPVLIQDARLRAVEAVSVWSHTRPDGSNWWELDPTNMYSECLSKGYKTPQSVVTAWMQSKTHREALLREDIDAMGIGGYIDPESGLIYTVFEGGYVS